MNDRERKVKEGMDKICEIMELSLEQYNIVEKILNDIYDDANGEWR